MLEEIILMLEQEADSAPSYDCEDCAYIAGIRTAIDIIEKFMRGTSDENKV